MLILFEITFLKNMFLLDIHLVILLKIFLYNERFLSVFNNKKGWENCGKSMLQQTIFFKHLTTNSVKLDYL